MNFSERLKVLIGCGNIKMKDLSNYLNYDISYISKWVNGRCLPSVKTAEEVIERMSKYFSRNLSISEVEDEIAKISGRNIPIDTMDRLENIILSLLQDGYYYSLHIEESKHSDSDTPIRVTGKTDEIPSDIVRIIKTYIATAEDDIEIYCAIGNMDFFRECVRYFNTFYLTRNISLKIRLIIRPDTYKHFSRSDMDVFYTMMSNLIFMDLQVLFSDIAEDTAYLYFKDHGYLDVRLNTLGEPMSLVHSEDSSKFKDYMKLVEKDTKGKLVAMKSTDKYPAEDRVAEYLVLNKPKKYITYQSFFDGAIPSDLLQKLIKREKVSNIQ